MKERYYNFHNILKVAVIGGFRKGIDSYFNMLYDYYRVDKIDTPNLVIYIKKFKPSKSNCYILDDYYYVKENYIYCKHRYKIAKWEVEIYGLDKDETIVYINPNLYAGLVAPGETISQLIRYKLAVMDFPVVHGYCIGKNNGAYLFPSSSGTGKTISAINFVKRGYKFFGDEKVILGSGEVYNFIFPLNIKYTYNRKKILNISFDYKTSIMSFFKRLLFYITFGQINLFANVLPQRLFPESIGIRSELRSIYIMIQGPEFAVEYNIDKNEFIKQLITNIQCEFIEFIGYILAYSYIFPHSEIAKFWARQEDIIKRHISNIPCHRIIVPKYYSMEIFNNILREIESVRG